MTKIRLLFIISILLISFIGFWQAFSFDFWGEDWEQIYFAVFDPPMINNPSEMQHPIVIYEELLLAKFFKFNTYYWQIFGYALKVLDSLSVSLMILGITKSKKAAFFGGLIFASSVVGIGSVTWVAAHTSALIIPIMCLGIYFWVIRKYYPLALTFLLISFWADPARSILGSFIVVLWEILSVIQNPKLLKESTKKVSLLLILLLAAFLLVKYFYYAESVSVWYNLHIVLTQPLRSLNNLLANLGNLIVGGMIPIPQTILAFSENNTLGTIVGYLFFFFIIFLTKKFIRKKSELLKISLIFLIWIPVFFLPNWLLSSQEMIGYGWVLGTTHRYFTLSSVGLVGFFVMVLLTIRNKNLKILLLLLLITSNLCISNWILSKESFYRSNAITSPIWDKINNDVPQGEENSLFTFYGEDKTRLNQLSQTKIAFGIKRDIRNFEQLPKSTVDPQIVNALLCGQEAGSPKIELSHFHIWKIVGSKIENVSELARNDYANLDCSKN